MIDIGEESGLLRSPMEERLSFLARGRAVDAGEAGEPAEMLSTLFRRLRDNWNAQPPPDDLGDVLERHPFFGDRVEGAASAPRSIASL